MAGDQNYWAGGYPGTSTVQISDNLLRCGQPALGADYVRLECIKLVIELKKQASLDGKTFALRPFIDELVKFVQTGEWGE